MFVVVVEGEVFPSPSRRIHQPQADLFGLEAVGVVDQVDGILDVI